MAAQSYTYEAKTRSGEAKVGEVEAESAEAALTRLRQQGLLVPKVKKKSQKAKFQFKFGTGISTKDLVVFTRQFATMINAGLPLVQCLELIGNQADNVHLKAVIFDVRGTVESGKTLAEALKKHPKVFNRLYTNLVAAGEASGMLDGILERLASHTEKNMKLVKQVRGAMVYPAAIMVVAFVVTMALLIFVIPTFQKMFAEMGGTLPGITQGVIDMSEFVRKWVLVILGSVVAAFFSIKRAIATARGRRFLDTMALKLPIISPIVKKVAVAKFTRTMGTMLSAGVNILDALEIVAGTAGNSVIEAGLLRVRTRISEGRPMAEPLGELPVFPPMVVQMISVGESTGAMDTMLTKIADFYDDEVDAAVGTMMALLEPAIMCVLAVVLGGLVISMYLPIFTMAGGASGS